MEKKQAIALSSLFDMYATSTSSTYEINKLETVNGSLQNFHQWSNGKPLVAGYHVVKSGGDSYYLLLIDWHRNDNLYVVLYSHNKSTTLAEIHQIEKLGEVSHLKWKYNPLKRDGKNAQRKAYFLRLFGTTTIHIPFPKSILGIEPFLNQLFELCSNRIIADKR